MIGLKIGQFIQLGVDGYWYIKEIPKGLFDMDYLLDESNYRPMNYIEAKGRCLFLGYTRYSCYFLDLISLKNPIKI